ncbi:flavoprotein monooxygenase acting on aromatic compound [Hahella sp. CCB-MM4]|uniref:FAD-dependent monooxygenase n=1 Tax=Hahella sp. (strain CCB-MM4) TaxID=1926491 RepID=UPI000B9C3299|nr:FAD-dependent monooxygenase [Hahella sp. CCB-MM4]OZG71110.1 flavoprotein monooxygenase acting on aromatic compound [Hahella sp. CCB-MM4]
MKVAILGAGVAGVSTAIALRQKGFHVSIYERHEKQSSIGAGVVLWPNASFVLGRLGVLDEVKAVAGRPTKMQRLSVQNDDLGALDIGLINHHMAHPSLSILRRDLQSILIAKLNTLNVSIQYGHTVEDIKAITSEQTEVYFQNGLRVSADVIIGADGRMASTARHFVCGEHAPVFQGMINWIGVFESENDIFSEIVVSDYWGIGERFGIVPVAANKAYWAGGVACDQIGTREPANYKTELTGIFSDWPEPVRQMIEHTPVHQINKIYLHDHDPTPIWHRNNLIMIGDAAHAPLPTSGQGACQALEDAWHIANCLETFPDNLYQAFEKFTALRLAKTTSITMAGRGLAASLFNRDKEFCRLRNENSKQTDFEKAAVGMAHLWGQHLPILMT